MQVPAPAKLNLFLHITGRRPDGYHELQTIFRFIDLADTLDLKVRDDGRLVREGGLNDIAPEQDLVIRAARALQAATGCQAGATIRVTKRIPAGGGLGGGSSDAASTLIALNRLWALGLKRTDLLRIGLTLGADVPVFIGGHNAFAQGIGEQLTPISLPPAHYWVLHPGVSVPTAAIFTHPGLTRHCAPITMADFSEVTVAASSARNVMEPVATSLFREVEYALAWLNQCPQGLGPARMSGSGGCCFLPVPAGARAPTPPPGMQIWSSAGLAQHPLLDWLPD